LSEPEEALAIGRSERDQITAAALLNMALSGGDWHWVRSV